MGWNDLDRMVKWREGGGERAEGRSGANLPALSRRCKESVFCRKRQTFSSIKSFGFSIDCRKTPDHLPQIGCIICVARAVENQTQIRSRD